MRTLFARTRRTYNDGLHVMYGVPSVSLVYEIFVGTFGISMAGRAGKGGGRREGRETEAFTENEPDTACTVTKRTDG